MEKIKIIKKIRDLKKKLFLCYFYSKKFLDEVESEVEFRPVRVLLFYQTFVEITRNFTVCSDRLCIRVGI